MNIEILSVRKGGECSFHARHIIRGISCKVFQGISRYMQDISCRAFHAGQFGFMRHYVKLNMALCLGLPYDIVHDVRFSFGF